MNSAPTQIAHLNIGLLRHPFDDPRSAGFTENVSKVNQLAERSDGFVWRCADDHEAMASEGVELLGGDPCAISALSVWESADDLDAFVTRTVHGAFLKRRGEWFRQPDGPNYVLWPIPKGHRPGYREALERLSMLEAKGPGEAAFDFKYMRQRAQQEAE